MKKPIFIKEHVRESQNVTVKAHYRTTKAKTPEDIKAMSINLMDAVFRDNLGDVKEAVKLGADIHYNGDDPIIMSSTMQNHDITLFLLKQIKGMSAMDIQRTYKSVVNDLPTFLKKSLLLHFL